MYTYNMRGETVDRMEFGRELGERLRSFRQGQGLDRALVAKEAGISLHVMGLYERGCRVPGAWDLARIAEALDCTLDELVPLTSERIGR